MTIREFCYRFICAAIAAIPVWILSINYHCNVVEKIGLISATMLVAFIVIDAFNEIFDYLYFKHLRQNKISMENNDVHGITVEMNNEVYHEYIEELKHLYEDYSFLMKD